MKKWVSLVALVVVVAALAAPAGAEAKSSFALAGEARALEIALGDQGLTLGFALSRADSGPSAVGVAAGQCAVLGQEADPDELPCNEETTQKTTLEEPGEAGDQLCAGPAIPAPLDSVLTVDIACGESFSGLTRGVPFTRNAGKVAEAALEFDLSGLLPQAQDAKKQVVDALQEVLDQAPDEIENALDQLLDSIDVGQAAQIIAGPATSDISAKGGKLTVSSTAAGARIGVVGIPSLDKEGLPIPGSSQATEDGLIIVEVGASNATATVNKFSATADADALAAIVTVKVRDITKAKPTYIEQSVAPGQTVTVLEGTPAESTITAAAATTEVNGRSAAAAADAVRLHLLKGVEGGLVIGLGRATAAANIATVQAARKRPPTEVLPVTGGTDMTGLVLALMLAAGGALALRRRVRG
jgi:hypothetical protein